MRWTRMVLLLAGSLLPAASAAAAGQVPQASLVAKEFSFILRPSP